VTSLDAPLDIDPDLSIGDSVADEGDTAPDTRVEHEEIVRHVREWVAQLSDKQRSVIECRYGLGAEETRTLEELARELGVTRERVRQIQLEALAQLRRRLLRDGLDKDALL
jgi:RNA polymerase nonessential primary-like sigma factor